MENDSSRPDESSVSKRQKVSHQGSLPTILQHECYTIAWLCALHIELAAAQAMLDEFHGSLPLHPGDTNNYVLGRIKGQNIVMACLPADQYGTINAAIVATNLKRTFPNICLTLMVGIGGGVPSKCDIRLGDVVVGIRVMQYDLGKIGSDGRFERTAVPRVQQPMVGTVLNKLRAKHELDPSRTSSILQQKLQGKIEYTRPSAPDLLFQATYEHQPEHLNCDLCDQSKLIPRVVRQPATVRIHYGAIASGNQVMKHGSTRDNVSRELDIICFEMEAAGLMDITPCLPIRGICDYSDSHKNKEWQRYAAATASAYARELIEELPMAQEQALIVFRSGTDQTMPRNHKSLFMRSLAFKQMYSRRMTIKENHKKTCQWFLSHPDYKAWLHPTSITQHHGFLWISGKPGAGKSTLMKFAYSHAKKKCRGTVKIASFFFNARGEYLEKSTLGMYRSLLLQLLEEYRDLQKVLDNPDILPEFQEDCPPLETLKGLFCDAISALGSRQFTCFIDALDECDEQQVMDMVEFFEDLGEQAEENNIQFRVCFSSRHYPYIVLKRGIRLILEDQPGHGEDLETYMRTRLRFKNPSVIESLLPDLLRKAAGVFMWVVLVVQILNDEDRRGGLALKKRLAEIPSDLSELFRDILTRDTKDMDTLLIVIRWILFAKRPLAPNEFHHAVWSGLSLTEGRVDSQVPTGIHHQDSLDITVISWSKGLAEITKSESPTVQFIHESVRDFFLKDNGLRILWPEMHTDWTSSSHEELKKYCEVYLGLHLVSTHIESLPPSSNAAAREEISKQYPFLEYATQGILFHANAAAGAVVQNAFLSKFPRERWIKMNNLFEKHKIREYTSAAGLLYIFADKGYPNLVRTWLTEDSQIHILGERYRYPLFAALASGNRETVAALLNLPSTIVNGTDILEGLTNRKDLNQYKARTPLSWAAQEGRLELTRFLLGTGLAIDERDGGGRTGLSRAAENGHEAVAAFLIENGANVNSLYRHRVSVYDYALHGRHEAVAVLLIKNGVHLHSSGLFGPPKLHYASSEGYNDIVRLLTEKGTGIDVNSIDDEGETALHKTSSRGHEAIARLLIERGANINIGNRNGDTALHKASSRGHDAIIRLLIENGAQINISTHNGDTALHTASSRGHDATARLLIEKGAQINIGNHNGDTALHTASSQGHDATARLLIEKGAQINIGNHNGDTALHKASSRGHDAIIRLLIEKGAQINIGNHNGDTAFHTASSRGHDATARLLIEKGAQANITNKWRETALHQASGRGYVATARFLIENDADVNLGDHNGDTALHRASSRGYEAIARLLFENGAQVNIGNQNGETALHKASNGDHKAVAKFLIENKADINISDRWGETALHEASVRGCWAVARILIEDGADIDIRNQKGETALHKASFAGHETIVRLLVNNGADINIRNQKGETALHYAIRMGNQALTRLLKESIERSR